MKPVALNVALFLIDAKQASLWSILLYCLQYELDSHQISYTVFNSHSTEEQKQQLKKLASRFPQPFTGLILQTHTSEDPELNELVKTLTHKSVRVISLDAEALGKTPNALISIENEQAQRLITEYVFSKLNYLGKVACIHGDPRRSPGRERSLGFRKSLAAAPNISLVAETDLDWITPGRGFDIGYQFAERTLTQHPELKAIICANDSSALGVSAYLQKQELIPKVLISGFDGGPQILHAVHKKVVTASLNQSPRGIAEACVKYLLQPASPSTPFEILHTPFELITSDNVEQISFSYLKLIPTLIRIQNTNHLKAELTQKQIITSQELTLATLAAVSNTLSHIRNLDMMLKKVLDLIGERFKLQYAAIYLSESINKEYMSDKYYNRRVIYQHDEQHSLEESIRTPINHQALFDYAKTKGIVINQHTHDAYDRLPEVIHNSNLAIPLVVDQMVVGILEVIAAEEHLFADDSYQILQTVAEQISVTIVVDNLIDKQEKTNKSLDTELHHKINLLRENEERFHLVSRATNDVVWDWDIHNNTIWRNENFHTLYGYSSYATSASEDLWTERIHPEDQARIRDTLFSALASDETAWVCEYRFQKADSTFAFVLDRGYIIRDEKGKAKRIIGAMLDITERKQAEEDLELAAMVYVHSSEAMMVTDSDNKIIAINQAFTKLTGYTIEEVLEKDPKLLASGRESKDFFIEMWQALKQTGHWQGEIWNRHKNGELIAESLTINTIYQQDNVVHRYVALFSDITQKKENEAIIWQQANIDPLTNLPNRRNFRNRLEQNIEQSRRQNLSLAILFIDLDKFKEVNDTLGHGMGDILLIEAARRISNCVRKSDTVARLGGDEFTVTLSELNDLTSVEKIVENIIASLAAPFQLGNETAFVSGSIGITLFPNDGQEIDELLKQADQALYVAKDAGRNRFSYFTPSLQVAAVTRMRLTNDLRNALKNNELLLFFQPIVELKTNQIQKAEVLIRWKHPTRGMVNPMDFIPLAESSGIIVEIGQWIFRESAKWVKKWRKQLNPHFQVSVNFSPVEFQRETKQFSGLIEFLSEIDLPGNAIVAEITEGLLLDANQTVNEKLVTLRKAGFQIALDDFGTGYSSLSYLKKFPFDFLKIDQSFTRNLSEGSSDMALSEAIIVMAHKLKLKVIAEGVETEAQKKYS